MEQRQTGVVLCLFLSQFACKANTQSPVVDPYVIHRADQPIVMNGRRDDSAWQQAVRSRAFVPALGGPRAVQPTHASLLWDDQNLYVFVEMADIDVYSDYHAHDDPLWKQDVVEVFVDADQNRRGYIEVQVNPNNAQFDAWFPTIRGETSDSA